MEKKKILLVDDNEANLSLMQGILRNQYKVYPIGSGREALEFLDKLRPDLMLLDVKMPEMSGIDLMRLIKADKNLADIPVIFLTGLTDTENEALAFELGAVDYLHKPVNSVVMMARVKLHLELEAYRKELQKLVEVKTAEVLKLERITIDLLARINEYRDLDTGNHVKRTAGYVCVIMDNLPRDLPETYRISKDLYINIQKSTPLHDIGKISIPDSILHKPGKLTDEEFSVMKTHTTTGAELLQNEIKEFEGSSFLDVALEMVLTHHEKWNGTGYPCGLSGESIPISGRIMALADVYDALTSERPYKPEFPHEQAMKIIESDAGKHFDPVLTEVFIKAQEDIRKISIQYKSLSCDVNADASS